MQECFLQKRTKLSRHAVDSLASRSSIARHEGSGTNSSFRRLLRETGLNSGRSFYCLRKTGASEIERIDSGVTEMYLAHAERGMKRNYAERNWSALDKGLEMLYAILSPAS